MRNDNLIVYKYRNWKDKFHKNLLSKNEVFLTQPKKLNDPFDCTIPICYHLLNSDKKILKCAQLEVNRHRSQLLKNGRDLSEELNKRIYDLKNNMSSIQKLDSEFDFISFNKHYGVLSLSKNWNNILMWSHYSDSHKGYCVGFWKNKLSSSLNGLCKPVVYNRKNQYPLIDPMLEPSEKNDLKIYHKAFDWKYEAEYRLKKFFEQEASDLDRKVLIQNDCFAEITIGMSASSDTERRILSIARKKKIKVYKAIQVPFKFKLDRIEIK